MPKRESAIQQSALCVAPTREQRLALNTILHHDLITCPYMKRTEIFEAVMKKANLANSPTAERAKHKKHFDNFYRSASVKGATLIYNFYREQVAKEQYVKTAPPHIARAIETAFGFTLPEGPATASLENVFNRMTDRYSEKGGIVVDHIAYMSGAYAGIWDGVRYIAQGDPSAVPPEEPRLIRVALQIFPQAPGDPQCLPRFRVHYRPGEAPHSEFFRTSDGSILSIGSGAHMLFIGYEHHTGYPVQIVASQELGQISPELIRSFLALVVRKHDAGPMIASRIMFWRSSVQSINDLTPKIGVYRESELREQFAKDHPGVDFDAVLENVTNRLGAGGKGGIQL